MDKASWDKVKWRLIGNHRGYSKEELELGVDGKTLPTKLCANATPDKGGDRTWLVSAPI